jgi:hypothetical protein
VKLTEIALSMVKFTSRKAWTGPSAVWRSNRDHSLFINRGLRASAHLDDGRWTTHQTPAGIFRRIALDLARVVSASILLSASRRMRRARVPELTPLIRCRAAMSSGPMARTSQPHRSG